MRLRLSSIALAVATFAGSEGFAQSAIDAEIAPMGKLRYGLNASNAALSARAADGSVSGISIDLGKFIAGRLGAAFEPVVYASTGDFTRSFEKGSWDITVVGTSPGAKEQFAFTPGSGLRVASCRRRLDAGDQHRATRARAPATGVQCWRAKRGGES
jgi:ABC-type amino acid transport substrate-binding protein